jgi:hypothetical protein
MAGLERALAALPPDPMRLAKYAEGLKRVGRFADAAAALRQAHQQKGELPWYGQRLQAAERDAALDRRLPRLDDGVFSPRKPAEVWDGVRVCYFSRRDRTAVRLAEQAMGDAAGRAQAPSGPNAQMCHVYAAARLGNAADADATEQARCRGLALSWLRFELTRQRANARSDDPRKWLAARKVLRLWQQHRDLAPVRDAAAIAALAEPERSGWTALWNEVEDLVRRIDTAGSPDLRRQP